MLYVAYENQATLPYDSLMQGIVKNDENLKHLTIWHHWHEISSVKGKLWIYQQTCFRKTRQKV